MATAASIGMVLATAPLAAQEGCELGYDGRNDVRTEALPDGSQITYIGGAHFTCEGGVQIWADSAVAYSPRGMSHLIGSVRYLESSREMFADEARYFTNEGRLQAEGNVSVRDEAQGSSIRNGYLVYLLKAEFREQEEMTVTTAADGLRPVAVLTPPPPDSSATEEAREARPTEPYTVVGDRIVLVGSGYFTASGTVEIERDSLQAFADSAEYDQEGGGLLLDGKARVVSAAYDLSGRTITMGAPGTEESEVHAFREARLEGDGLLLTASQIFLFLRDDALERLVAVPIAGRAAVNADSVDLVRPEAVVEDFVLTADSLELTAPGQTIERVFASGSARSVSSSGDSLNVELLPDIARSDWLEGDTVIVTFMRPDPPSGGVVTAAGETPTALAVEDIVARGNARSLYRLPPSDSTARLGTDPPAVHYVIGDEIQIEMVDQQVTSMQVVGQTRGVHLEPLQRRPPSDTAAVVVDTLGAVIDTMGTPPDTSGIFQIGSARGNEPRNESPTRNEPTAAPRARMENVPWNRH